MHRLDTPELLDEHDVPDADMERSLRDLRRFNSMAGGTRVYRAMVRRLLGGRGDATVIDLGAGTADLLDSLGFTLTVAVDVNIRHLLYRRKGSTSRRVVADAMRLPFRDGSVDAVTSSHVFHHFTPLQNVEIVTESLRVARTGIAFSDTRRHIAPLLFTLALGWFRLVGRVTRFDAPASVRRGYTTGEVRDIAAQSTATRKIVANYFPVRWVMLLWK